LHLQFTLLLLALLLFALLLLHIHGHGRPRLETGAEAAGRGLWWRRWRLFNVSIVVIAAGRVVRGGRLRISRLATAQHNLPGRSLALIANHNHVVAGALKKLGEHVARLAGAICAKNALV
jgi:hypothetical protein